MENITAKSDIQANTSKAATADQKKETSTASDTKKLVAKRNAHAPKKGNMSASSSIRKNTSKVATVKTKKMK